MDAQYQKIPRQDFDKHPFLARLLELHEIPEEIHIEGTLPVVTIDEYGRSSPRILSVVGSRKHTQYGKSAIEKLIADLQGEDIVILSGLAHGIDSIAHSAALKNNITTFAILGNGLDKKVMYPSSHLHLRQDIVDHGGLILSELAPDTRAAKWTFPARNRIVAALSDAVLIVEAEELSGTLITARLALELGKDIGAIPGEIFSPTSHGTNMLIREGAYCIAGKEDLYALLHLSPNESTTNARSFTDDEKCIMDNLLEPTDKDTLLFKTGLVLSDFLTALSTLEINGVIEENFGEIRKIV